MKTTFATTAAAALLGLPAILVANLPASAQEPIRMATSWAGGPHLEFFAKGFANNVDRLTGGKVKFQVFPAGTIGSALKVSESVQKKIAPAGHHWPGYDWGLDKASVIFGGYPGSPGIEAYLHWLYEAGAAKMWAEWRLEKFGLIAMPCGSHSDEMHMHSKKPVKTIEDLKGLKWRTAGASAEIASALGASTVILAGGEVYPALERGVVDAIEWATPAINYPLGFHKIAKYIILPGVHQPAAAQECIFDKALWDKFDPQTKILIEEAAYRTTVESWMQLNYQDTEALDKYKKEGIEIIRVDDSYIAAWKKATREWEDKYAAEGGWFKKALDSKRTFEERWNGAKQYRMELK
jgi:TRAP-type mannitol/chloroaromatic compound transport system substrate-binding protein